MKKDSNCCDLIRVDFFRGLRSIVKKELENYQEVCIVRETDESFYIKYFSSYNRLRLLKSVLRVYLISEDKNYTPKYVARHKSLLGNIVERVLSESDDDFKTFKIVCAGSDSPEVRSIADYVRERFGLVESDRADLKLYMIKPSDVWQVGVEITSRPLSLRNYKVMNMDGAMDPTVAYAVNSLVNINSQGRYLNVFSGSGTLLIEAIMAFGSVAEFIGFDNNKKHLSLAIKNIKKAGLIKKVKLYERDILNMPYDPGKFDSITADMPFGMSVSKGEDLNLLYERFIEFCQSSLKEKGTLVAYTNQVALFEAVVSKSEFRVTKKIEIRYHAYLKPCIFVCKL